MEGRQQKFCLNYDPRKDAPYLTHPYGWAMRHLFWVLWRKVTTRYRESIVFSCIVELLSMYTVPLMITGMEILIDLLHKSHNAPVPYPTMHHFVTEMYTFLLQNGALCDIQLMHCGICEMDLLRHEITPIRTIIRHNTSHHSSRFVFFKMSVILNKILMTGQNCQKLLMRFGKALCINTYFQGWLSWPHDAICRYRSGSTLVQVMACFLLSTRLICPGHVQLYDLSGTREW